MTTTLEVNIAPNISKVLRDGAHVGYRVYVRGIDPETGKSRKYAKRFGPAFTLEQLVAYRDAGAIAMVAPPEAASGFTGDARRYLALAAVKAMPSYPARTREIESWIAIFGDTSREDIDTNAINEGLYRLKKDDYSNSSVNKFRTALMSLWTTLDGRSARNPVRDSVMFQEADLAARGQEEALIVRILEAIPDERGRAIDRQALYLAVWNDPATTVAKQYAVSSTFLKRICRRLVIPTPPRGYWTMPPYARGPRPPLPRSATTGESADLLKSRARLEVLYRTGMDPLQLARMNPATDLSFAGDGWYSPPYRQKGKRITRTPRIPVRLPMTPAARAAFHRLLAVDGFGPFNGKSLLNTWVAAQRRVERELRAEYDDPTFRLPHIRIKDLRHSYGTDLFAHSNGDESYVAQMLMHAPGSPMTRRYSLGAVPSVLREKTDKVARVLSIAKRGK